MDVSVSTFVNYRYRHVPVSTGHCESALTSAIASCTILRGGSRVVTAAVFTVFSTLRTATSAGLGGCMWTPLLTGGCCCWRYWRLVVRRPLQPAFAHLQLIVFNFVLSLLYKKPSWLIMSPPFLDFINSIVGYGKFFKHVIPHITAFSSDRPMNL